MGKPKLTLVPVRTSRHGEHTPLNQARMDRLPGLLRGQILALMLRAPGQVGCAPSKATWSTQVAGGLLAHVATGSVLNFVTGPVLHFACQLTTISLPSSRACYWMEDPADGVQVKLGRQTPDKLHR